MTTAGVFDTMAITEQYFTYRILFYMMADFMKLKNDYLDRMVSITYICVPKIVLSNVGATTSKKQFDQMFFTH